MNRKFRENKSLGNLRKKAEKRKRNGEFNPADDSQSEFMRLNYELDVHRVELEMQNEELRRTNKALEESRNEFSDLYQGWIFSGKRNPAVGINSEEFLS